MSISLQNVRGTWNNSQNSLRGLPKSPTESTGPHYYDYSESFLDEEDCFSPVAEETVANPPFTMDQTILETQLGLERRHAQSPFGTMQGSIFRPAELPTGHNRRASEQSKYSYAGVIPPRKSSLGATATPVRSGSTVQRLIQRSATADPVILGRTSKEENYQTRTSTASRRTVGSPHASAFFPNACRSPRDLTTLAARVHSPVFDEKPGTRAISDTVQAGHQPDHNTPSDVNDVHAQLQPRWELPSFSFRPLSFVAHATETRERPKTSSAAQHKSTIEILSPMPERPMSSQSRKGFSRIFEIEETFSADNNKVTSTAQTFARLSAVKEQPDLQTLEAASAASPESEGDRMSGLDDEDVQPQPADQKHPGINARCNNVTIHDRSTVESLLDQHIECLGLHEDATSQFDTSDESEQSEVADECIANNSVKMSSITLESASYPSFRPTTSSSCQPSSLTSSERRKLVPRRLFASMDSKLSSGAVLQNSSETSSGQFSSAITSSTTTGQISSGWQTLPSTSGFASVQSATKASLTSGDLADIDSDPPLNKFKVRRISDMSASTSGSTKKLHEVDGDLSPIKTCAFHRRSKSDIFARQESHRRRRARIRLQAKRKSVSLGHLADDNSDQGQPETLGADEDWETTESPEDITLNSPLTGYAELSGDSISAQPPTMVSAGSVLLPSSVPRRWTSMLAAMPEPVKKSIDVVRKASIRTVRSHRSNTSITNPLNSTRMNSQLPRLGSVPQLAPSDFGPPLTSSNLDLSLRLPEPPRIIRPPLRQVQSFFSDDSSARGMRHGTRKRFDLHSLRSGLTRSSGMLGTRGSTARHTQAEVKTNQSCQIRSRKSSDYAQSSLGDTVPMTDFAYKKRKVLDRFKDWWKRHACKRGIHREERRGRPQ
ncbi:hypothetical protein LTR98_009873 [Exophiala xenobiotica]|uniref:Uncharacterized protein n=1 Tax=Vermiconidia calcicola TaxID=1690605 RepID=A0AAV9QAW1_9PEZI|nr:hypothetical protein LTR98_009873 [Exophiala xenobiotica]KAK5430584.1 hypothetical protein LTR34_006311 [Exophiala xenobiotica]KAK5537458.1 hypothetical protein LTR25_004710 [Vermiconidia calcicola]KAK5539300.1 hypothetical protein LTR23_006716 [Chaetothyriales sp. CCFEE 6169]